MASILIAGCSKDDKPLIFTPIDLDLFSREHKGFNLLGKYDVNWSNDGFQEEDFIILKDLGFNFARLPLDYRTYTEPGNWDVFIPQELSEIDKAVEWGKKYGVHVCINLHRAPGYCVNYSAVPSNQNLDLWTNEVAQKAFVQHWSYFAERFRNVHYSELSFNLVNEPRDMDEATYVAVMHKAIDRIQQINPDRIIFVDGLNYGRKTIPSLRGETNVIQAIHAYDPMTLTHYQASWVDGSDTWPVPVWPMIDISQYLYGPWQNQYHSSLILEGTFTKDTQVILNIRQVSVRSTLQVKLDEAIVFNKQFICGPDLGEDWTKIVLTQWGYQNISGKNYTAALPADGNRLTITNIEGDWMSLNSLTIRSGSGEVVIIPANGSWGSEQGTYKITPDGLVTYEDGKPVTVLSSLRNTLEMAGKDNIPVMIQEFGVYNKTPHQVALDYLEDLVSVFNETHTGFAMWNMTGSMGIIDSGREDFTYESYRGKLLDREMLTILQGEVK